MGWPNSRLLLIGAAALLPLSAAAQSVDRFAVDRFHAAPTVEDGLQMQLPRTLGALRWSAQLTLDYAQGSLVVRQDEGGDKVGSLLDHSLAAELFAALGLGKRWEIFVGMPVVLYQTGEDPAQLGVANLPQPAVAGVGQPQLGGSVLAVGQAEHAGGFKLGFAAALLLPVGEQDALSSDDGVGVRGRALASYGLLDGKVMPVLNLGASYRPASDYGSARIGSELTFGVGLHSHWLQHALVLMAEVYGASGLLDDQFGKRLSTPLEALLGARYTLPFGLSLGGGVALGLSEAVGSPNLRTVLTLGYAPPRPTARPLTQAPKPRRDSDGDGIFDADDRCPQVPEDRDEFADDDGCPETDNDGDGIADVEDGCPEEPEVYNQYQDDDGCPDSKLEVRIEEGQIVMPSPIEFRINSAELLPESLPSLTQVAGVLREHGDITVLSIEGHTSDEGSDATNLDLSRRRAKSVMRWLIEQGIDAKRLRARGYGKRRPLFANDTDEHRHLNRRVEFIIVEQGP